MIVARERRFTNGCCRPRQHVPLRALAGIARRAVEVEPQGVGPRQFTLDGLASVSEFYFQARIMSLEEQALD